MSKYKKPLPTPTAESREFWKGCRRQELVIQRCGKCATLRHYPRPMCPHCNSTETEYVRVSGRGKLYTWTVVYHPVHPAFAEVPYIVAIVELEEGIRLVTNIIGCPPEKLYAEMPVEVVFDVVNEDSALPKFTPSLPKI